MLLLSVTQGQARGQQRVRWKATGKGGVNMPRAVLCSTARSMGTGRPSCSVVKNSPAVTGSKQINHE